MSLNASSVNLQRAQLANGNESLLRASAAAMADDMSISSLSPLSPPAAPFNEQMIPRSSNGQILHPLMTITNEGPQLENAQLVNAMAVPLPTDQSTDIALLPHAGRMSGPANPGGPISPDKGQLKQAVQIMAQQVHATNESAENMVRGMADKFQGLARQYHDEMSDHVERRVATVQVECAQQAQDALASQANVIVHNGNQVLNQQLNQQARTLTLQKDRLLDEQRIQLEKETNQLLISQRNEMAVQGNQLLEQHKSDIIAQASNEIQQREQAVMQSCQVQVQNVLNSEIQTNLKHQSEVTRLEQEAKLAAQAAINEQNKARLDAEKFQAEILNLQNLLQQNANAHQKQNETTSAQLHQMENKFKAQQESEALQHKVELDKARRQQQAELEQIRSQNQDMTRQMEQQFDALSEMVKQSQAELLEARKAIPVDVTPPARAACSPCGNLTGQSAYTNQQMFGEPCRTPSCFTGLGNRLDEDSKENKPPKPPNVKEPPVIPNTPNASCSGPAQTQEQFVPLKSALRAQSEGPQVRVSTKAEYHTIASDNDDEYEAGYYWSDVLNDYKWWDPNEEDEYDFLPGDTGEVTNNDENADTKRNPHQMVDGTETDGNDTSGDDWMEEHKEKNTWNTSHLKFDPIPNQNQFRSWRYTCRERVAACCPRPSKARIYWRQTEVTAKWELLTDKRQWEKFGQRVAVELYKICKGELKHQIDEINMAKDKAGEDPLNARQMYWLILNHLKRSEGRIGVNNIQDLFKVELRGGRSTWFPARLDQMSPQLSSQAR